VATTAGLILSALFLWWFSTGAVLYVIGLPQTNRPGLMFAASAAALLSLYVLYATRDTATASAACTAFCAALVIWSWHEISFLTGVVTGPRTVPLKGRGDGISTERAPLSDAIETVIYHEAAIALTVATAAALTWDSPNATGLWTLLVLWVMRLSAKLNVYLGVPNLSEHFLPPHLSYLKTYFCRRPMNLLFPVSITVPTVVTLMLGAAAADPAASEYTSASLTLVATLLGLAVVEHWFMVLPLPSAELWSWGLKSRDQASVASAPQSPPARPAIRSAG
jgi:putative photosynthetic complex assembly protein 2